jgi:phage virion morphogenesis protein
MSTQAAEGLRHWLDGLALSLEPAQSKRLMQSLAQGLRIRTRQRIISQRDPEGHRFIPRKRDQLGRIRRHAMFSKLPRQLKTQYSSDHAAVGFAGRTGKIARIHHEGRSDKPHPHAQPVRYARRELVGFSADDQRWIFAAIRNHLQSIN